MRLQLGKYYAWRMNAGDDLGCIFVVVRASPDRAVVKAVVNMSRSLGIDDRLDGGVGAGSSVDLHSKELTLEEAAALRIAGVIPERFR